MTNEFNRDADGITVRSTSGPWTSHQLGDLMSAGRFGGLSRTQSLRVAAGLVCYDVIAQDVSKTPFNLYRMTAQGPEKVMPSEHPLALRLQRGPNSWMGTKEWLRLTAFHAAIFQEATTLVRRNGVGEPVEMYAQIPERCRAQVNLQARSYYYELTKASSHELVQLAWAPNRVPASDVLHFRMRTLDGLVALPSSVLGREVYETLTNMRKFVGDMFKRGGVDIFAMLFPDPLTDVQFERVQRGMKAAVTKAQSDGQPLVLEGKSATVPEIKSLTMASADSEFVKTNTAIIQEACRLLRVPPHKVFALDDVKYDNIEPLDRIYVGDTLGMYFDTIEEVANRGLLSDGEGDLFFAFDRDAAYTTDPKTRNEMWLKRWEDGVAELDEVRAAMKMKRYGNEAGRARLIKGSAVMVDPENNIIMNSKAGAAMSDGEDPQEPASDSQDDAEANKTAALRLV